MNTQSTSPPPYSTQVAPDGGLPATAWSNWFKQVWQFLGGPFIGGQLIQNTAVSAGGTAISHNLGQTPEVWTLCDQQSSATVWRTAWDSKTITLRSSSNCTVSVWVN